MCQVNLYAIGYCSTLNTNKMKNCFYQLLLALIILLPGRVGAVVNERPFVIPELREWKGGEGVFTPSAGTRICVGKEAALLRIGKQFARDYELMFNQKPLL